MKKQLLLLVMVLWAATSFSQEATRTTSWHIRIVTAEPSEEGLLPAPIEYTYVAEKPTGREIARFLEQRSVELEKWAVFRKIVTLAATRCGQVKRFERGVVFEGSGWKADGVSWSSTIKPGPVGPITVTLVGKGVWLASKVEQIDDYSDEFEKFDESKWQTDVGSWSPHWSWDAEHVSVADGSLRIKVTHDPHEREGKEVPYKSGIVKSKAPPILYGYFEARIKAAPLSPGVCPAFWLYNDSPKHHTEIDVIELTQEKTPKTLWCSSHVFMLPGETEKARRASKHKLEAAFDPRDDYHVYGCDWTKEAIVWYVDGTEVARQANDNLHQPLNIALSLGIRPPLTTRPSEAGFPTEFEVDYVRVWPSRP